MFNDKALRDEIISRATRTLEAGTTETEDGKFASDLDAMLAAGISMVELMQEKGLNDHFFMEETPDFKYPPFEQFDEATTVELGQLIGDVMIAVNPSAYVSLSSKTPSLNTAKRKAEFEFKPLAPASEWEQVGDGSIDYVVFDEGELKPKTGYGLKRFRMADNIWFDIFTNDYPHGGGTDENGNPIPLTLWTAEIHAPQAKAPIMGMVAPEWFVGSWFEQNPSLHGMLRTFPQDTEHEAWAKIYDWWVNASWRYL